MKYIYKFLLVFVGVISLISLSGCDGELPLNIPFTKEFVLNGNIPVTKTETVNFNDYPEYQDNENKIRDLNYVAAAFRVLQLDNTNLTANVTVVIKGGGLTLFQRTLNNVRPADYMTNPYDFDLNQSEIDMVNTYLSLTTNRTFEGTVTISGPSGTVNARVAVDMVLEAVTEI
ncbi:MAG: hypothetical protein ACM3O3_12175 [Syntrophothermus sp.]